MTDSFILFRLFFDEQYCSCQSLRHLSNEMQLNVGCHLQTLTIAFCCFAEVHYNIKWYSNLGLSWLFQANVIITSLVVPSKVFCSFWIWLSVAIQIPQQMRKGNILSRSTVAGVIITHGQPMPYNWRKLLRMWRYDLLLLYQIQLNNRIWRVYSLFYHYSKSYII